jgi:predicted nucleic acid-binding protein
MAEGFIDTNAFIHAQTHDARSEECLRFLEAVREDRVRARLDPLIAHELSNAPRHFRKEMVRRSGGVPPRGPGPRGACGR